MKLVKIVAILIFRPPHVLGRYKCGRAKSVAQKSSFYKFPEYMQLSSIFLEASCNKNCTFSEKNGGIWRGRPKFTNLCNGFCTTELLYRYSRTFFSTHNCLLKIFICGLFTTIKYTIAKVSQV